MGKSRLLEFHRLVLDFRYSRTAAQHCFLFRYRLARTLGSGQLDQQLTYGWAQDACALDHCTGVGLRRRFVGHWRAHTDFDDFLSKYGKSLGNISLDESDNMLPRDSSIDSPSLPSAGLRHTAEQHSLAFATTCSTHLPAWYCGRNPAQERQLIAIC